MNFLWRKNNGNRYILDLFSKDGVNHKHVLISYLVAPFQDEIGLSHSNKFESLFIAKAFDSLGFVVDIVHYKANILGEPVFDDKKYDVVFGLEPNFLEAKRRFKPLVSIYYATGSHFAFQNEAELKRLENLRIRRGIQLRPVRRVAPHQSSSEADAVIGILNEYTAASYIGEAKKVYRLPISASNPFPYPSLNFLKKGGGRRGFLWFGSYGAVHKGLDLVLEAFKDFPEVDLFICGGVSGEKDFVKAFGNELFCLPNIHFLGWVNVNSFAFFNLVMKCDFVILPSASESINGAVPTCMYSGLIPVVTRETGVDVEGCGVLLQEASVSSIIHTVRELSFMSRESIERLATASYRKSLSHYSVINFSEKFKSSLESVLGQNGLIDSSGL